MAKIMLVEDDNNLREIYEARLLAEGYEIVSARDGEEALAVAVKEKPDLIISDIMMPKISGFDMLDILRSTPETKNTKVVMMTALSQSEDKQRAEKLGADRYLVKSQVTLEDVAKVAREMLGQEDTPAAAAAVAPVADANTQPAAPLPEPTPAIPVAVTTAPEPVATPPTPITVQPEPVVASPAPAVDVSTAVVPVAEPPATPPVNDVATPPPATDDTSSAAPSVAPAGRKILIADEPATPPPATDDGLIHPTDPVPPPATPATEEPSVETAVPRPQVTQELGDGQISHKKTIQPLNDVSSHTDINQLLAAEEAKEAKTQAVNTAIADTSNQTSGPNISIDANGTIEPTKTSSDPNAIAL